MGRKTKAAIAGVAIGGLWYAVSNFDKVDYINHKMASLFHNHQTEQVPNTKVNQPSGFLEKMVGSSSHSYSRDSIATPSPNDSAGGIYNERYRSGQPANYYTNKLDGILKQFDANYPDFEGLGKLLEEMAPQLNFLESTEDSGIITGKTKVRNEKLGFGFLVSNNGDMGVQFMNDDSYVFGNGYNIGMKYSDDNSQLDIGVSNLNRGDANQTTLGSNPLTLTANNKAHMLSITKNGNVLTNIFPNMLTPNYEFTEPAYFNVRGFALLPLTIQQRIQK